MLITTSHLGIGYHYFSTDVDLRVCLIFHMKTTMSWSVKRTITGVESSEFVHDILKLRKEEKMKQEIYQRVINEPEFKDKRIELEEGIERLRLKINHIQEMNLKTPSKHWDDVFAFIENTTVLLFLLLLILHVCRIIVVVLLPELFLECVLEEGAFEPSKFGMNFHLSWTMLFGDYPCVPVYLNCVDDDTKLDHIPLP